MSDFIDDSKALRKRLDDFYDALPMELRAEFEALIEKQYAIGKRYAVEQMARALTDASEFTVTIETR